MEGWELRRRRHAGGLTLAEVARAAGTSVPNLSAYERGTKVAHATTLARLVDSVNAGAQSVVHRRGLLTVPATAALLRRGLRAEWSTADLLRVVRQMRSESLHLQSDVDRQAFFAQPSTTGDPRWDALLAGAVEDLFVTRGEQPPAWTAGHALPTFWFVGSSQSLHAYALSRTPMSLQVRGVMLDPADLEAV